MIVTILALCSLALAAIPCRCILRNLREYETLPRSQPGARPPGSDRVSVLVPARNEEHNIRATLEAILANRSVDLEVILLDDQSTDRTAAIGHEIRQGDPRLRVESAPALPDGWCGKQHACHVLSTLARHPLLVFLDADVRLAPDALERMAGFVAVRQVDLASGIPLQECRTFSERLLIPLVHFILLGFLPVWRMRRSTHPALAAGCGQLVIVRADAYRASGGHSRIRTTLHDGLKLPRLLRSAGFRTDLFDASDAASCRMYRCNKDVWRGLRKNAIEGLASPSMIIPVTVVLLGGQILPFVLLAIAPSLSTTALIATSIAAGLAFFARLALAGRFRQPLDSAVLHPAGVLALLLIQWHALALWLTGRPVSWRDRIYPPNSDGKAGHRSDRTEGAASYASS